MNEKLLVSRIAFVDFNGKKALQNAKGKKNLSYNYLKNTCPKIISGIKTLKKWIEEINN